MDAVNEKAEGETENNAQKQKKLILIRHSESINNVAKRDAYDAWSNLTSFKSFPTWSQVCSTASLLAVPMNTDLSEEGLQMVSNLRRIMDESDFMKTHNVELVVHSTLIRAARTCRVVFENTDIPILEHESIFEKNITEHLNIADMNDRIAQFTSWLLNRPEDCIVVVGHSAFFREMLKTDVKLKNCEVRSCLLNRDGSLEAGSEVTIIAGGEDLLSLSQKQEEEVVN